MSKRQGADNSALESAHIGDLLSPYLDGEVTASEARQVERHLAECAACRADLDLLQQTVALLRSAPHVVPPRALTLSEADVRPYLAEGRRPFWRRLRWAAGLAGAALGLALVVGVAAVVRQSLLPAAPPEQIIAMEAAPPAEEPTLELKEAPIEMFAAPVEEDAAVEAEVLPERALGAPDEAPQPSLEAPALAAAAEAAPEEVRRVGAPIEDARVDVEPGRVTVTVTLEIPAGTSLYVELWREDSQLNWGLAESDQQTVVVGAEGRLHFVLEPLPEAEEADLNASAGRYIILLFNDRLDPPYAGEISFETPLHTAD